MIMEISKQVFARGFDEVIHVHESIITAVVGVGNIFMMFFVKLGGAKFELLTDLSSW